MPTDKELQKTRDRIAEKRTKLFGARAAYDSSVREQANDLEATQLEAEEARLDAELNAAKTRSKATALKEGNASNLKAAQNALRAATGKPVETDTTLVPHDAPNTSGTAAGSEKAGNK